MLYSDNELVICEATPQAARPHRDADGVRAKGYKKRDWRKFPFGHYRGERVAAFGAVDMEVIDAADFPGMIKELEDSKSRLTDFTRSGRGNGGQPIPARDQNGKGYCWQHSGCSALVAIRARDDQPYADLSAYAGACIQKSYRDEGGWGAAGLDFIMERGLPTSKFWPQQSMSRANDNPATWKDAEQYKITEGWIDMARQQYDRTLTFGQMITCLLCRTPVITDFNWWGHSVCALDAVNGTSMMGKTRGGNGKLLRGKDFAKYWGTENEVTGGIAIRIWNSWGSTWSDQGYGVLTGNKAIPDGAVAPRVATYAPALMLARFPRLPRRTFR